jgi:hypothetical protein
MNGPLNPTDQLMSSNPFGAPAAQQIKSMRPAGTPPRAFSERWNQDNPNAPVPAKNLAPAPVAEEKPADPKPEPEIEQPKSLKSLKGPKAKKEKAANPISESRTQDGLPSYRCEFEGRDIMVGFPCYKTTNPVTAFTLLAMALDFGREKIRFDMEIGDAMIYHARNRIAAKFLDTDAKWLLMIDDDIIPSIGRPGWMRAWVSAARQLNDLPLQRNVIHRLVGSGKTIIGGAYFGRQEGGALMCSDLSLAPRARVYEDSVVPVEWVATGCLLVHRTVFEDIEKKFPELKASKPNEPFDYFHPMSSGEGEDVSFCKRAAASGHQPHIDLGLPVFHVGYKVY